MKSHAQEIGQPIIQQQLRVKIKRNFALSNVILTTKKLEIECSGVSSSFAVRGILGVHHEISRVDNDPSTLLLIYYYPIAEKPSLEIIQPRQIIYLHFEEQGQSRAENEETAERWRTLLLLCALGSEMTDEVPKRRFFVLLNPVSGRRKAVKIYQKVKELFFEADIGHKLVKTTHAGHAEEIMSTQDFGQFDAIVTISGDGLIYEVINGMMSRRDVKKDDLILAPLPAGSGNALVTSLCYLHPGPSMLSKALFAVLKSTPKLSRRRIPLLKAEYNGTVRYSVVNVTAGIIADADINSERLRFLGGPIRTSLYGAAYIMRKKNYSFAVSASDETDTPVLDKTDDYLGIALQVIPFIDEKMMLVPEAFGERPGLYFVQIKHQISRVDLLDLWNKAEDGGKHVHESDLMTNVKVKSIQIKSKEKILFTIDGEAVYTEHLKATEVPDILRVLY